MLNVTLVEGEAVGGTTGERVGALFGETVGEEVDGG